MPIGNTNQLSISFLHNTLGSIAVDKRNLEHRVIQFAQIVNQEGQSGLEAIGMTATDAGNFITAVNHLLTNAQVYFGQASQAANFNFDATSDLIEARGGVIQ